jgi:hypothetical protein
VARNICRSVLAFAAERGMRLTYLDRRAYRAKDDPVVLDVLRERFGDFFLLPEGGSNPLAVRGCASFEPKGSAPVNTNADQPPGKGDITGERGSSATSDLGQETQITSSRPCSDA